MANYIATTEQFTATADAIRAKTGSSENLEWDASTGYADDIAAISTGTDTSDATAGAGDILSGKTAYVNGSKITGNIATKTASNLSASGKTVTVPAGYYATQATKSVATGSATVPASISGSSATVSTGTNTLTLSKTVSITPSVTTGYVSSGTAKNSSVSLTASVTTKAAATYTPTTSDQTISAGQYLTGTQTVKGDSNLVASKIKNGVSIFGVSGTYKLLQITSQPPAYIKGKVGQSFSVSVSVNKTNVSYQWKYFYSTIVYPYSGGDQIRNFENGTSSTLTKTAKIQWNKWTMFCEITDNETGDKVYTTPTYLYVYTQ